MVCSLTGVVDISTERYMYALYLLLILWSVTRLKKHQYLIQTYSISVFANINLF